jgi:hypothetical protein
MGMLRVDNLQAALEHVEISDVVPDQRPHVEWLLEADGADPEQLKAALDHPDPMTRKYGVIAAARLAGLGVQAPFVDAGPVLHALSSDDSEVRQFAEFAHRILEIELRSRSRNLRSHWKPVRQKPPRSRRFW